MSGHSHWAGIKHKKAANDAKRGKIWSKIARIIIVSAKAGGGDPNQNLSLRYAIDKAKDANMPKDTIEKAIKKGTGEGSDATSFEEVLYEGYGPEGVAVMVEALTDNRNRTSPEVKRVFEKVGGSLGTSGCVNWMFEKKGLILIPTADNDEDAIMEIVLSAGADDMTTVGENFEITCVPTAYEELKKAITDNNIETIVSEITMLPQNTIPIKDENIAKRILKMIDSFEDHEDVQNVYSNFEISDDLIEKLS